MDDNMSHLARVPKKDAELTLRLESEVLQALALIATERDISTSALIRKVLKVWLRLADGFRRHVGYV